MMPTFRLSRAETAHLMEVIEKINHRAQKNKLVGHYEIVSSEPTTWTDENGHDRVGMLVEVEGESPKIEGWEVLAQLDWTHGEEALIHAFRDEEYTGVTDYTTHQECEHCHSNRDRNKTYILRNSETGEEKQVGSACLKDFLGLNIPLSFWFPEEEFREISEGNFERWVLDYEPRYIYAVAYALTNTYGFRRSSDMGATRDAIYSYLHDKNPKWPVELDLIEKGKLEFDEVLQKIQTPGFDDKSDYLHNLRIVLTSGSCMMKDFGLIASAPNTFARIREGAERKAREHETQKQSHHIGVVGKKMTAKVTRGKVRYYTNNYGTGAIETLTTTNGSILKWFTKSTLLTKFEEGEEFTIEFKVKKHEEYNDVKQTIISFVKVI